MGMGVLHVVWADLGNPYPEGDGVSLRYPVPLKFSKFTQPRGEVEDGGQVLSQKRKMGRQTQEL